MDRSFSNIAEEALKLPSNEQLRLARTLLESNEATGDLGAEAAWEDEIQLAHNAPHILWPAGKYEVREIQHA